MSTGGVTRVCRALLVALNVCLAQRGRGFQSQAIVRPKLRLTVPTVVVVVALDPAALASNSPLKLGLRHAVSAYRGGPWGQWSRVGAAQGSIIASGTLRSSNRYHDDAQLHLDALVLGDGNALQAHG